MRAAAGDGVRFLGHIDDVPALFGAADIAVVPSIWGEAFGLVTAEAMACGAAVIASDAGALPEVVGEAGFIFHAGDAGDLAHKLRRLIADPDLRAALGTAGRVRALRPRPLCPRRHRCLCSCP